MSDSVTFMFTELFRDIGVAADAALWVGVGLRVTASRPVGTVHLLDGPWRALEIDTALRKVLGSRRFTTGAPPPLAELLPLPRVGSLRCGLARVDASGVVSNRSTIQALGWRCGDELHLTLVAGSGGHPAGQAVPGAAVGGAASLWAAGGRPGAGRRRPRTPSPMNTPGRLGITPRPGAFVQTHLEVKRLNPRS